MSLPEPHHVMQTLVRSERPLLVVGRGSGADGYASAIGLSEYLKKKGKDPKVVAVDGKTPTSLHFLSQHEQVTDSIPDLRRLLIEIQTKKTQIKSWTYEARGDVFLLNFIPEQGAWGEHDVRVVHGGWRYDLLVCVGAASLEDCERFVREQPDFFYSTPIVNIDHRVENEHYGHINLVDMTANSCGEVCHRLLAATDPDALDAELATAFLTGTVAKTKSFKTPSVSPTTLQHAGELVSLGARREEIVRHLFRTRQVGALRLWGRALARVKHDATLGLVSTMLSRQDFLHAGAEEQDIQGLLDELLSSCPDAKMTLLLYETEAHTIAGILRCADSDARLLTAPFSPEGNRERVTFSCAPFSFPQAEEAIKKAIQEGLKK